MTLTEPTSRLQNQALVPLAHHRVVQRDTADGAMVRVGELGCPPASTLVVLNGRGVTVCETGPDDATVWLPTGGPYDVMVEVDDKQKPLAVDVYVGDLWLLAGQSNMEGSGRLAGREAPDPAVRVHDMAGRWRTAEEPLHMKWLSPYSAHERVQQENEADNAERELRKGPSPVVYQEGQLDADEPRFDGMALGVGPGVAFANALVQLTGVPVGLIPAAHGGSSMKQWSPKLPTDDTSLFGAALQSVATAGGRVRGLLWYQGESESDTDAPWTYDDDLATLFEGFRAHLGRPDLEVLCVQLGRYTLPDRDPAFDLRWSRIREAQRTCPGATRMVSAVDLDLDDPIHISAEGQLRLGRRLARIATGQLPPALGRVEVINDGLVVNVSFTGVAGSLSQQGRRLIGFSVRKPDGADCDMIFREEVVDDGATVRLRMSRPVEPQDQLWYGYGADPVCTVVDGDDMAIPAFGPIALADL